MECSTGFQNFSLDRILSHDDTAGGIDFGIAGMDQDAEEMRHIMQIWHFLLVPGTVLKSDFISPGRNGSLGIDLFLAGTGTAARVSGQVAGSSLTASSMVLQKNLPSMDRSPMV